MTFDEYVELPNGAKLRVIETGKIVEKLNKTTIEINNKIFVWCVRYMDDGNALTMAYLPEELEVALATEKKCTCDFYKVILTTGCKCGGK